MSKKLIFLLTLAVVFLPLMAFAVQSPAESLSGSGGGLIPQCEGAFCRACDLVELSNNVITFAIGFSVIVATLMFAYAGILYVTAANAGQEQIKKAHKIFVNIFVGLLIVLLAWLLVNIMFSVLTGKGLDVWSKIECHANPTTAPFASQSDRNVGGSNVVTGGTGTGGVAGGTPISSPGGTLRHAEALRRLVADGVCGGTTGTPCLALPGASLEGVHPALIDQAIALHNGCRCTFGINSATDGRHATGGDYTHGKGWKLDIQHSNNPALQAFIRNSAGPLRFSQHFDVFARTSAGVPYSADVYIDRCGNRYAMEPNILDLQVRGTACSY